MSTEVPLADLSNGKRMPIIGFGTAQCKGDVLQKTLNAALECGYRHIDTAAIYGNEDEIGDVLQQWIASGKVSREELFITTKLPPVGNRPADVGKWLDRSLKKLKLDYVDLYLIHFPVAKKSENDDDVVGKDLDYNTDLLGTYKAMEEQVYAGKARAIGLSNFNSKQIKKIVTVCRIKPANHQVEVHAYHQQRPLRQICQENRITICAYAPIGAPYAKRDDYEQYPRLLEHPVVRSIAQRLNKTPAQILLRHLIQLGLIVIPKSSKPDRVKENFQVFDFKLGKLEMAELDALDRGSDNNAGRIFPLQIQEGLKSHPEYPFNIPF